MLSINAIELKFPVSLSIQIFKLKIVSIEFNEFDDENQTEKKKKKTLF